MYNTYMIEMRGMIGEFEKLVFKKYSDYNSRGKRRIL